MKNVIMAACQYASVLILISVVSADFTIEEFVKGKKLVDVITLTRTVSIIFISLFVFAGQINEVTYN